MIDEFPLGAADKRLHKIYALAEYCASFGTEGCPETQLIINGQKRGNQTKKVLEYITLLVNWGIITRHADRYRVLEWNYDQWAEAKGFKERTYNFKCQNPGCEAYYGSKLDKCPSCQTPNPLISNEPRGYTHTQPRSGIIPIKETIEQTTELYTHTHEENDEKGHLPRSERVKEGRRAEKRVVELLSEFGAAVLGPGRGGLPDVYFNRESRCYAVEVKSVDHQTRSKGKSVAGYKVGSVPLSVSQWRALCGYADGNGKIPLMVVEVKIKGSNKGSNYHFIPREVVDDRVSRSKGKHLRFSVHDLAGMSIQSIREGLPVIGGFRL